METTTDWLVRLLLFFLLEYFVQWKHFHRFVISNAYSFILLSELKNLTQPQVFPKSKVFMVGSMATFCCVVPVEQSFETGVMSVNFVNSRENTIKISDRTYTLTVNMSQATEQSCINIICQTSKPSHSGACAYVGCKYNSEFRKIWGFLEYKYKGILLMNVKLLALVFGTTQTHQMTRIFCVRPKIYSRLNVTGEREGTRLHSRIPQFISYLGGKNKTESMAMEFECCAEYFKECSRGLCRTCCSHSKKTEPRRRYNSKEEAC